MQKWIENYKKYLRFIKDRDKYKSVSKIMRKE